MITVRLPRRHVQNDRSEYEDVDWMEAAAADMANADEGQSTTFHGESDRRIAGLYGGNIQKLRDVFCLWKFLLLVNCLRLLTT